jgi:hypothetical protein
LKAFLKYKVILLLPYLSFCQGFRAFVGGLTGCGLETRGILHLKIAGFKYLVFEHPF